MKIIIKLGLNKDLSDKTFETCTEWLKICAIGSLKTQESSQRVSTLYHQSGSFILQLLTNGKVKQWLRYVNGNDYYLYFKYVSFIIKKSELKKVVQTFTTTSQYKFYRSNIKWCLKWLEIMFKFGGKES